VTHETLQQLLAELSAAFCARDVDRLLALFADHQDATYAGSEQHERATGTDALRVLFTQLLAREEVYTFSFPHLSWVTAGQAVGVLADGTGTQTDPRGTTEQFTYRVCGVLVAAATGWRWMLLSGSEPTQAAGDPRLTSTQQATPCGGFDARPASPRQPGGRRRRPLQLFSPRWCWSRAIDATWPGPAPA